MTSPSPIPAAKPVMTDPALTAIVTAVQSDSPALAPAIARRVERSREADSVCMMGGWTA